MTATAERPRWRAGKLCGHKHVLMTDNPCPGDPCRSVRYRHGVGGGVVVCPCCDRSDLMPGGNATDGVVPSA